MAASLASMTDRELLRLYHVGGDASAREVLVQRHLPLVRSLARRYAGRGEALEDIEQVGAIGLINAIANEFQTTPEQVLEAMEAGSAYAPASLSQGPGGEEGDLDPMETIGSM